MTPRIPHPATCIQIGVVSLRWCAKHAAAIVQHFDEVRARNAASGARSYNHNRVSGNIVGVKSEMATYQFIRSALPPRDRQQVRPVFKDFWGSKRRFPGRKELHGDINVMEGKLVVEVKALRLRRSEMPPDPLHPDEDWARFSCCIPPNQLKKYVEQNAAVVWAVTSVDTDDDGVLLMGWTWARDVNDHGKFRYTCTANIQVDRDQHMRPMSELADLVRSLSENNE